MEQPTESHIATGRRRLSLPPALQYPAYRAYWLGMLASVSGFQMFRAAQAWFVYELTGNPLFLGYALAANAVPAIFFNLVGGVYADRIDKRRLIIVTQAVSASLIFLLAILTLSDVVKVWHILVIAAVAGAVEAIDTPARQAIYPHLIDRRVMMSAVALNSSIWSGNRIIAPAIGGLIIAQSNVETSFFVAGAGFVIMAAVMYALRVPPIERVATGSPARSLLEGLNYIRTNFLFSFLIGMTFFSSFFGMAYVMLMPIFAVDILDV
ncbi:MAG: MFS transporter, partial [Planctomycetes bacterium]|nr:MFS transporter [Planctomycetota bacterium]